MRYLNLTPPGQLAMRRGSIRRANMALGLAFIFLINSVGPFPAAHADSALGLPTPGSMVNLSPAYEPVMIKGLTVHKDNPFLFDFIVDVGQDHLMGEPLKKEGERLIKYFLASLAIPDKDVWVNLSPYEKQRIIPEVLSQTDMGRDMLEQDYMLKQITASLIYPEKQLGKKFWDEVYSKAQAQYGTTNIPVNTFNKVWITADRAEVFEHNQTAFVVDSHLKVMLEEDYLALIKHQRQPAPRTNAIASQIIKRIILPQLEHEVNTGKNFANLRQIFNSVILASWYKRNLKQALLNQVYANQSKVKGINLNDPSIKELIYDQYLKAYKKGVFNYIKDDINATGQTLPRKYFSGGITNLDPSLAMTSDPAALATAIPDRRLMLFGTDINITDQADFAINKAMNGQEVVLTLYRAQSKDPLKLTRDKIKKITDEFYIINGNRIESSDVQLYYSNGNLQSSRVLEGAIMRWLSSRTSDFINHVYVPRFYNIVPLAKVLVGEFEQTPDENGRVIYIKMKPDEAMQAGLTPKGEAFADNFAIGETNPRALGLIIASRLRLNLNDLESVLENGNVNSRLGAISVLASEELRTRLKLDLESSWKILNRNLHQKNFLVRSDVYIALAKVDILRARPLLIEGMKDEYPNVRISLTVYVSGDIVDFLDDDHIAQIRDLLERNKKEIYQDRDSFERRQIEAAEAKIDYYLEMVSKIDADDVVDRLDNNLTDPKPVDQRIMVVQMLKKRTDLFKDKRVRDLVYAHARAPRPSGGFENIGVVRAFCNEAIYLADALESRDFLIASTRNENEINPLTARMNILTLAKPIDGAYPFKDDEEVLDALTSLSKNYSLVIRTAARTALASLKSNAMVRFEPGPQRPSEDGAMRTELTYRAGEFIGNFTNDKPNPKEEGIELAKRLGLNVVDIESILDNGNSYAHQAIIRALADQGLRNYLHLDTEKIWNLLILNLNRKNDHVRRDAYIAMSKIDMLRARPYLIKGMSDGIEIVRRWVATCVSGDIVDFLDQDNIAEIRNLLERIRGELSKEGNSFEIEQIDKGISKIDYYLEKVGKIDAKYVFDGLNNDSTNFEAVDQRIMVAQMLKKRTDLFKDKGVRELLYAHARAPNTGNGSEKIYVVRVFCNEAIYLADSLGARDFLIGSTQSENEINPLAARMNILTLAKPINGEYPFKHDHRVWDRLTFLSRSPLLLIRRAAREAVETLRNNAMVSAADAAMLIDIQQLEMMLSLRGAPDDLHRLELWKLYVNELSQEPEKFATVEALFQFLKRVPGMGDWLVEKAEKLNSLIEKNRSVQMRIKMILLAMNKILEEWESHRNNFLIVDIRPTSVMYINGEIEVYISAVFDFKLRDRLSMMLRGEGGQMRFGQLRGHGHTLVPLGRQYAFNVDGRGNGFDVIHEKQNYARVRTSAGKFLGYANVSNEVKYFYDGKKVAVVSFDAEGQCKVESFGDEGISFISEIVNPELAPVDFAMKVYDEAWIRKTLPPTWEEIEAQVHYLVATGRQNKLSQDYENEEMMVDYLEYFPRTPLKGIPARFHDECDKLLRVMMVCFVTHYMSGHRVIMEFEKEHRPLLFNQGKDPLIQVAQTVLNRFSYSNFLKSIGNSPDEFPGVDKTGIKKHDVVVYKNPDGEIRLFYNYNGAVPEELLRGNPHVIARESYAMTTTPGGINLNTSNGMRWKINKDGRGVEMNIDPAMIARIRHDGIESLSPKIFSITPITSIWSLVGLSAPSK